jgi:hypothetical protein
VRVEEPGGTTKAGLKLAFAPDGNPLTVRFTVPLYPLEGARVTVYMAFVPGSAVTEEGVAPMEKSGVGAPPQEGNLNVAMRVLQLNVPLVCKYSFVYQKVQSSTGSTLIPV